MAKHGWPTTWQGALQVELRAEAAGLASRGWPVFPGTPAEVKSFEFDEVPDETAYQSPTPIQENWRELIGARPEVMATWWQQSFSLLLATGITVDAVEVDAELGQRAARLLRAAGQPSPIVAMPNGRWLFLSTVADRIPGPLLENPEIRCHGKESWIPLPPTSLTHGVVHWRVRPDVWGWQLPEAAAVHDVLIRALVSDDVESAMPQLMLT